VFRFTCHFRWGYLFSNNRKVNRYFKTDGKIEIAVIEMFALLPT